MGSKSHRRCELPEEACKRARSPLPRRRRCRCARPGAGSPRRARRAGSAARRQSPRRARRCRRRERPAVAPVAHEPPAAAPTASLAMTARPRFIASLTARPHGSRNVAWRSTARRARRRRHRGCAAPPARRVEPERPPRPQRPAAPPAGTQGGQDPTPTRTSAAGGARRPVVRQASISTPSPFSRAGRPTNRNFVAALPAEPGQSAPARRSAARRVDSGALQKELSTAWGATWTLRAPRALT